METILTLFGATADGETAIVRLILPDVSAETIEALLELPTPLFNRVKVEFYSAAGGEDVLTEVGFESGDDIAVALYQTTRIHLDRVAMLTPAAAS